MIRLHAGLLFGWHWQMALFTYFLYCENQQSDELLIKQNDNISTFVYFGLTVVNRFKHGPRPRHLLITFLCLIIIVIMGRLYSVLCLHRRPTDRHIHCRCLRRYFYCRCFLCLCMPASPLKPNTQGGWVQRRAAASTRIEQKYKERNEKCYSNERTNAIWYVNKLCTYCSSVSSTLTLFLAAPYTLLAT